MLNLKRFIEACQVITSLQDADPRLKGKEYYKDEKWSEADKLTMRRLHTALHYYDTFITTDKLSNISSAYLEHWWELPGRDELKHEVLRQVMGPRHF